MKLEVCVDNAAGLQAAIDGGADRIELCSCLAVGGLTPSVGLMHLASASPIPVYAMIRPRGDNFHFSPQEIDQMKREIDAVRNTNLAGVVLGAHNPDFSLDAECLSELTKHAEGLGTTLHRVIDLCEDLREPIDLAVELGFKRILTSGGTLKAELGLQRLAQMNEIAANRITIMPGSGINALNIAKILQVSDFKEIHAGCGSMTSADERLAQFGFSAQMQTATDPEKVRALKTAMNAFIPSHR